jgi:hypothetical protein
MRYLQANKNIYWARANVQWYNLIETYSRQTPKPLKHTANSLEILRISMLVMVWLCSRLEVFHDNQVSPCFI